MLYFGLVELMLLDSARELAEARRFRARVVAETLAENAAEYAAQQMVTRAATPQFRIETEQGVISGNMTKTAAGFEINGEGVTAGITESRATVILRGEIVSNVVKIQYSWHQ